MILVQNMTEKRREFLKAVKRLRSDDPEKFFELYKVHLSVLLELSTEEIDRSLRSAPELALREKSKMTSSTMNEKFHMDSPKRIRKRIGSSEFLDALDMDENAVEIFKALTDILRRPENLSEEGIFRKSGSRSREEDLRCRLLSADQDKLSCISDNSVNAHDCASVLKKLLRSLKEPLLTKAHFDIYLKNADFTESENCASDVKEARKTRRLDVCRLLVMLLPLENKKVLKMLLILLNNVAQKESVNRMDALNLATVFVPCILLPDQVSPVEVTDVEGNLSLLLELMIKHYKEIFLPPHKFIMDVLQEIKHRDKENGEEVVESSIQFADRKEMVNYDGKEYTALAMAELYASIACMPEGHDKQRRLKQLQKHSRENVRTPDKGIKAVGAKFVKSVKKKLAVGRSAKYEPGDTISLKSYDSGISSENFLGPLSTRNNRSCDGLDSVSDYSSLTIESSTSWDYYPSRSVSKKKQCSKKTTDSMDTVVPIRKTVLSQL